MSAYHWLGEPYNGLPDNGGDGVDNKTSTGALMRGGASADPYRYQSAINLATRLGRTAAANALIRRLEAQGGTNDPSQGADYNDYENQPDLGTTASLRGLLSVNSKRRGDGPIRPGVFTAQTNRMMGENAAKYGKDYLAEQFNPNIDKGINFAQDLMDNPPVGATAEANMRGQMMSALKGTHEDNMRQAAATFGIRGLNPSSAAGSAVLANLSLQSDAELSRALTDNGLQVQNINRTARMQASGMLTDLISKRMAANLSINDPSKLMELNDQVGGLLEALRTQSELRQYQEEQAREAQGRWRQQARYSAYAQGLSNLGSYFGAGSGASSVSPSSGGGTSGGSGGGGFYQMGSGGGSSYGQNFNSGSAAGSFYQSGASSYSPNNGNYSPGMEPDRYDYAGGGMA